MLRHNTVNVDKVAEKQRLQAPDMLHRVCLEKLLKTEQPTLNIHNQLVRQDLMLLHILQRVCLLTDLKLLGILPA